MFASTMWYVALFHYHNQIKQILFSSFIVKNTETQKDIQLPMGTVSGFGIRLY